MHFQFKIHGRDLANIQLSETKEMVVDILPHNFVHKFSPFLQNQKQNAGFALDNQLRDYKYIKFHK